MRAAVVEAMGRPPAPTEVPEPRRRPGEALVRIGAAALNPVELHIWNGHFFDGPPRPPYVIGLEGVGVVEEGERLAPGTRVRVEFVHPGYGRDGAVAEYAVAPEEPDASDRASQASVAPIGDQLDDTAAAALGVPVFTALMCLERAEEAGASLEGAHVLVIGATGAVGMVAVQLAKLMGAARVVAAGRNGERLKRALSLGADAAVELGDGLAPGELRDRFAEAAGGRLDVALDPLWGRSARAAIDAITREGVYVSFGQAASPVAELSGIPLRNRRVTVVGHSGAWATPEDRRTALARAFELAGRRGAALTLDTDEIALEQIGDAWEWLSRSAGRKLVVKP
ncbi:MAG: zinc-binding alcohol dehydrogenase family protein [Thermoleophilaceae bacterium]|nr:zinc-binding alcohol dehydrogenase family protein [Thermoleophilaceae bacterium]